jgi:uncharacterized protein YlxW (UPF0749 family)
MSYEKSQYLHNSSTGKSLQSSQDNDLMRIIEAINAKVENLATEVREIKLAIKSQSNNQDLTNDLREENRKLKDDVHSCAHARTLFTLRFELLYL